MGCRRAEDRTVSNVTEAGSPWRRSSVAALPASESSGCMMMKDIPVLDQSVLINVGRELS